MSCGSFRREIFSSQVQLAPAMASRRQRVTVFLLLVAISFSPFLSERITPTRGIPPMISKELPNPAMTAHAERLQLISGLLFSPIFLLHAVWIAGITLFAVIALTHTFLLLVFVCCTVCVDYATSGRLPAERTRSRSATIIIMHAAMQAQNLHVHVCYLAKVICPLEHKHVHLVYITHLYSQIKLQICIMLINL